MRRKLVVAMFPALVLAVSACSLSEGAAPKVVLAKNGQVLFPVVFFLLGPSQFEGWQHFLFGNRP
jgi:hypothetical protein